MRHDELTGKAYPIPPVAENPYLVDFAPPILTRDLSEGQVGAPLGGEVLYGRWAAVCPDAGPPCRSNGTAATTPPTPNDCG